MMLMLPERGHTMYGTKHHTCHTGSTRDVSEKNKMVNRKLPRRFLFHFESTLISRRPETFDNGVASL